MAAYIVPCFEMSPSVCLSVDKSPAFDSCLDVKKEDQLAELSCRRLLVWYVSSYMIHCGSPVRFFSIGWQA